MTVLVVLLTIVEVIVCLLLVLLVLLQRSKDEGLGMAFGNAMGESLFGAQAGTVLTKATVILGILFMANTIALDRLHSGTARTGSGSIMDAVPDTAPMTAPIETAPLVTEESAMPAAPMQPSVMPESAPLTVETPMPAIPVSSAASATPTEAAPAAAPVEAPAAAPQP